MVLRCLVLCFGLLSAAPSFAQTEADLPAIAQVFADGLRDRGYGDVAVSWTWLGRLRVVGVIDGQAREIILHPTSGEVLRDVMVRVQPPTGMADRQDGGKDGTDAEALAARGDAAGDTGAPFAQDLLDPADAPDAAAAP